MATALEECCWSEAVMCTNITDRQYGKGQVEEAAKGYVARLAEFPIDVIGEAFEQWRDANARVVPRAIPSASAIALIAGEIMSARRAETERGVAPAPFTRPSPEFVRAHVAFERRVKLLYKAAGEHDHRERRIAVIDEETGDESYRTVSGRDGCPICGPAGDARRDQVAEMLAALPKPKTATFLCAICHDTGWRLGGDQRREACECKRQPTIGDF